MFVLNLNVNDFAGTQISKMQIKKKYNSVWEKWALEWEKASNIRKENMKCFVSYIEKKSPDIIVLQEFEYTDLTIENCLKKLEENYYVVEPYLFKEDKDSNEKVVGNSIVLMLISKRLTKINEEMLACSIPQILNVRQYRWLEKEYLNYSILGVYIPEESDDSVVMLNTSIINTLDRIERNKKVIILGDFNANYKNNKYQKNCNRINLLKQINISERTILDVWEKSVIDNKAFIINEDNVESKCVDKDKVTYKNKTRIDYAFGSSDITISKMVIDDTTLKFTDHSALLLYIDN